MANVVLIVVLILALALIAVVLLQRSEGGGLGMGGGGGGGLVSSRGAATALSKLTWIFGAAFMAATLFLTILSAQSASNRSVLDQIGADARSPAPAAPAGGGLGNDLLPPSSSDQPLVPPPAD